MEVFRSFGATDVHCARRDDVCTQLRLCACDRDQAPDLRQKAITGIRPPAIRKPARLYAEPGPYWPPRGRTEPLPGGDARGSPRTRPRPLPEEAAR